MFKEAKEVIVECFTNRSRMVKLARYELKAQNSNTLFGFLWNFLNPALQIIIYWFVFSVGLNSASPKGGYSHIIWLVTGVIPWFYMSAVMMSTTLAIYAYSGILKRMNFPMSIVPIKSVISGFMAHILAMGVVYVLAFISGAQLMLQSLYIVYFMAATLLFLFGYSLLFSSITVLAKDVQKFMSSVIRLLFYISPVAWVQDGLPYNIRFILKLNPFDYLITGYRNAILYPQDINIISRQTIYFWSLTIFLFFVGCKAHMRLKKHFFDLI